MTYEATAIKNSKGLGKRIAITEIDKLSTGTIAWFLVKRHKFGLLCTWAVVATVLYFAPFVPSLIMSVLF